MADAVIVSFVIDNGKFLFPLCEGEGKLSLPAVGSAVPTISGGPQARDYRIENQVGIAFAGIPT